MVSIKSYYTAFGVSKRLLLFLLALAFSCQVRAQLINSARLDNLPPKTTLDSLIAQLDVVSRQMDLSQYQEGLTAIESILDKMGQLDSVPDFYLIDAWIKAASLYSLLDECEKALPMCNKALIHSKKCFGEKNEQYAQSLDLLSFIYYQRGDIDKALLLGKQSCDLFLELPYSPNYIYALNDLAAYYFDSGDCENAISIGLLVQKKALSEWGSNNAFYINTLNNLARFFAGIGDVDNAILYSEEALRTCVETGQKSTYSYARSLEHLANYYYQQNDFQLAINYAENALPVLDSLFGNSSFEYINVLRDLARFYIGVENKEKATLCIEELERKVEGAIIRAFATMSSKERASYWNWYNEWYYYYLPLYCERIRSDDLFAILYNSSLFSKGLLLSADIEERKLYDDGEIDGVSSLFLDLKKAYKESDKLFYKNQGVTHEQDSINQIIDSLSFLLANRSPYYGLAIQSQRVRWEDIQNRLGNNEVAIEFIKIEDEPEVYYAALTLKKDYAAPRFTMLFNYNELCDVPQESYYRKPLLGKLIWSNLIDELSGSDGVFFSPTGVLHGIGIEYLPVTDSTTISDLFSLYRLTSTREILHRDHENRHFRAVLFGGLNYDCRLADSVSVNKTDTTGFLSYDLYRGISRKGGFREIPKTLQEVTQIAQILVDSFPKCEVYTNNAGTEQSFRELSGSTVNILHLATHGDFIPFDRTINHQIISDRLLETDHRCYSKEDLAMTRSFVVFSGVNALMDTSLVVSDQTNDGVLTAMEVSELNFRDLDLVVLSACNTGLGALSEDGVIGLQRGFKKAGANALIMSLWKVEDEPTMYLMTHFYQYLMEGDGINFAFHKAQNMLKSQYGTSGARPYWASFILLDAF
jgi:hypothetical protein